MLGFYALTFLLTVLMMDETNLQTQILVCFYLIMVVMTSQSLAFQLWKSNSQTHLDITRNAILQTTADVCKFKAYQQEIDFVMVNFKSLKYGIICLKFLYVLWLCVCFLSQPSPLTVASVAKACYSDSVISFRTSIYTINAFNAWVDVWHPSNGSYHFDDEKFLSGRQLITKGLSAVKSNVRKQSYEAARLALGKILHTLQVWHNITAKYYYKMNLMTKCCPSLMGD